MRFWELTPKQLIADLDAAAERMRRTRNENMSLAWHSAWLQRAKKMPPLKSLMVEATGNQSPKRQDWREQLSTMQSWMDRRRASKRGQ